MIITAKWNSACPVCTKLISAGSACDWQKGKKATHVACASAEAKETLEASRASAPAANATIPVPEAPAGLNYLPFQAAGIQFALARFAAGKNGVLVADEMGLGKTIQALGVCNGLAPAAEKPLNVLVVCPASLRLNWAREASKWLVGRWEVTTFLKTDKVLTARSDVAIPYAQHSLTVVNYDILSKVPCVHGTEWDVLIVDESHYAKNGKAKRTQFLAAIKSTRRVFLTGTPICNRPSELVSLLTQIEPSEWGAFGEQKAFFKFAYRFCNPTKVWTGFKYVTDFTGASNLDELQIKLRTGVMVRRMKADVLKELPPKTRQVVVLPENGASAAVKAERAAFGEDMAERLTAVADDADAYASLVAELTSPKAPSFEAISLARQALAIEKVPYVVDHVRQALEDNDGHKVVVMAHHKAVVDALMAGLGEFGAVKIDGSMGAEDREASVTKFQTDAATRVFVGSIMAAGVGITLTAAHHVVFAELDWVPGNVSQAEDRCHRIGQHDNVLVQHLVFDGSLDALLVQTILGKQAVISAGLDTQQAVVDAPAAMVARSAAKPAPKTAEEVAAGSEFTAEVREATMRGLKSLSAVCDGAHDEDGMGFNGRDSGFGKSLAARAFLTDSMTRAAIKMLRTYRNTQLSADVTSVLAPFWPTKAKAPKAAKADAPAAE
jgi:SWI/SNF-related matrix-associated actin-dependent regulator 1 of chromatin subfamily A